MEKQEGKALNVVLIIITAFFVVASAVNWVLEKTTDEGLDVNVLLKATPSWFWGGLAAIFILATLIGLVRFSKREATSKNAWAKNFLASSLNKWENLAARSVIVSDLTKFFTGGTPRLHDAEFGFIQSMEQLRIELFSILNFNLRLQIHESKSGDSGIIKFEKEAAKIQEKIKFFVPDMPSAVAATLDWMIGSIPKSMEEFSSTYEGDKAAPGWNRKKFIIYRLMYQLKEDIEAITDDPATADKLVPDIGMMERQKTERIRGIIGGYEKTTNNSYKSFKEYATIRVGAMRRLRSLTLEFQDMFNQQGFKKRGMRFAKEGAIPVIYRLKVYPGKDGNPINTLKIKECLGIGKPITYGGHLPVAQGGHHARFEVDEDGFFTKDTNDALFAKTYEQRTIRRITTPDEISVVPSSGTPLEHVYDWAKFEWQYYVQDLEFGTFHPWSRTIADYGNYIRFNKLDEAPFTNISGNRLTKPAFDREHMKDPGHFEYWGRSNYYSNQPEQVLEQGGNPFPYSSVKGQWEFIKETNEVLSGKKKWGYKILRDFAAESSRLVVEEKPE